MVVNAFETFSEIQLIVQHNLNGFKIQNSQHYKNIIQLINNTFHDVAYFYQIFLFC